MVALVLNSLPGKRSRPKLVMPIYQYHIIKDDRPVELFEVEQKLGDPPLTKHPLTREPVKRALSTPSLSLKHTSRNEKKSLHPDNLKKQGFTQYEKDSSGDYHRTVGSQGPAKISPNELEDTV
jgi:predicted nucleic acid-binding Zn ribbon protein